MIKEFVNDIKALGGLPIFTVIILVALLVGNLNLFAQLTVGLILAFGITALIRMIYFKPRPDKQKYRNFIEKIDASSFPSLHSMRAGLLATILTLYFNNMALGVLFGILAIVVAFTRVFLKRHFVSDTVVGLILGVVVGVISINLANLFLPAI